MAKKNRASEKQSSDKVLDDFVQKVNSINSQLSLSIGSFKNTQKNIEKINETLNKMASNKGALDEIKNAFGRITQNLNSFVDKTKSITPTGGGGGEGGGGGTGGGGGGGGNPDGNRDDNLDSLYFRLQAIIQGSELVVNSFAKLSQSISNFFPTLEPLKMFTGLISQAATAFASLPMQIDSLKMQLLGLGTNLENFQVEMAPQIDGLVGDRLKNVENAANLFSQGFRGNNRGLLDVASKLDITGQKTAALTNEFPKMSVLMQLNNNEMNNLAGSLFNTAQTFAVKTEDLIKVIGKLQNLEVMSTLGFGGEFANNLKDLAAKYKMGEDQIVKLTNALTNPAALQGLAKADPAILGLVSRLEKAGGPAEFESIFKEIVSRLNTFTGMLSNQAKGTGLPSTVIAQQLFQMFGMELTTASQLARVFTDRLSESEKQLQRERDLTDSLNASIQQLKTTVLPIITVITNFATSVLKGNGLFVILAATGLKIVSSMLQQVISYASLKIQIDRTSIAFQRAIQRVEGTGLDRGANRIFGGILGHPLFKSLAPLVGLAGPVGLAASFLIPMIGSLFDKKSEDTNVLNDIEKNTAISAKNSEPDQLIPQRTSIYSAIAKDMADMLSMRETFNNKVLEVLTQTKDATERHAQVAGVIGAEVIKAVEKKSLGGRPQ